MMWIVRLALRRPYTFVVFALLILILGVFSIACRRTSFPTSIFLWRRWCGATGMLSADQMANRIVTNAERGMTTTVNDIDHIESQSLVGVGIIKGLLQAAREHCAGGGAADGDQPDSTALAGTPGTTPPFIISTTRRRRTIARLGSRGRAC